MFVQGGDGLSGPRKNKAEISSRDEEGSPVFGGVGEESCNGIYRTKGMSLVNYSLFRLGCRLQFGLEWEEFIWAWVQNDHDSKPSQVLIKLKLGKVLSHDHFAPKPK